MKKILCRIVIPAFSLLFLCGTAYSDDNIDSSVTQQIEVTEEQTSIEENQQTAEISDSAQASESEQEMVCAETEDLEQTVESAENLDDLDDIFNDSADVEAVVSTEKTPDNIPEKNRGITFSGNLDTKAYGAVFYCKDPPDGYWDITPAASFIGKLSFTSRPKDYFNIKGTLQIEFPEMKVGVYELYCNYIIGNFATLTLGQRDLRWGHSKIFDSNILDDHADYVYDPTVILNKQPRSISDSQFSLMLALPIPHFNITAGGFYEDYAGTGIKGASIDNVFYAAIGEFSLKNLSMSIFGRTWAKNDPKAMDPAAGLEASFDIGNLHFYAQYFTHFQKNNEEGKFPLNFPRQKGTFSVWWMQTEPVKLGFILEYQFLYCWDSYSKGCLPDPTKKAKFNHYLAFQGAWGDIFGSPVTLAIKYMHDFSENYGTIVPGVSLHRIIPNAKIEFGVPIYYGNPEYRKYGVVAELALNVDF
ncbi:MAG: hypothetical protein MJ169_09085 [Treponema sp.]|nr:hypothetical protein [Treponema sp.]